MDILREHEWMRHNVQPRSLRLLDYLNRALRTLRFAGTANQALLDFDRCGFAVFKLVDTYWTGVHAGFAPRTLRAVNHYFYHVPTSN